jgi:microtubule-associated protein-like 1/2
LPEIAGGVKSIVAQQPGTSSTGLYVGTAKNLILEGGFDSKFQPLIVGHAKQLWGLAIHPTQPVFATAGYDRNILRWKSHRPEWRVQVQYECTSAAFNHDGSLIAVGSINGHITILKGDSGKHVSTFRSSNAPVSHMAFSPGMTHKHDINNE